MPQEKALRTLLLITSILMVKFTQEHITAPMVGRIGKFIQMTMGIRRAIHTGSMGSIATTISGMMMADRNEETGGV